jgi:putative transposase
MSTSYKFVDNKAIYFTTATVVGWSDARLTGRAGIYKGNVQNNIAGQYPALPAQSGIKNTCLGINDQPSAYHLQLHQGKDLGLIWRNIKSFTAMKIIDAIIKNTKESRKEHLLHTFKKAGKKSSSNFTYKFWEHENHPVLLDITEMYNQRLNYPPARQVIQAGTGILDGF